VEFRQRHRGGGIFFWGRGRVSRLRKDRYGRQNERPNISSNISYLSFQEFAKRLSITIEDACALVKASKRSNSSSSSGPVSEKLLGSS
jgi:hypothetical protein